MREKRSQLGKKSSCKREEMFVLFLLEQVSPLWLASLAQLPGACKASRWRIQVLSFGTRAVEAGRQGGGNHSARILDSPDDSPQPLSLMFPSGHLSVGFHESATSPQQCTHTGDLQLGLGGAVEGRRAGQGELAGITAQWPPELCVSPSIDLFPP